MKKIDFKQLKKNKKIALIVWFAIIIIGLFLGILGIVLALK